MGALQLAYQLGYRDIAIIGVDGGDSPRIEGGYSKNLSHLPLLFKSALKDVEITNLGNLKGFEKVSIKDWLEK